MKAVIYARVSSEEQVHGSSLDLQVSSCREFAKKKGYDIIGEFREDYTGTSATRPLLDDILEMSFDVLVVFSVDRFARKMAVQILLENEFAEKGIKIEYVTISNEDTPNDNLLKNMQSVIAEYEREQILRRTKSGLKARAKNGKVTHGYCSTYGYNYEDGNFVINQTEAEVVQLIYDMYTIKRYGTVKIARELTERGIPTKYTKVNGKHMGRSGWAGGTVLKMLKNETYIGSFHYDGTIVPTPPIISDAQFRKAQRVRNQNRRESPRRAKNTYIMRSRLKCGVCGTTFIVTSKTNQQGRTYYYYYCRGQHKSHFDDPPCSGSIRRDEVETQVWERVKALILAPEKVRALWESKDVDIEPLKKELTKQKEKRGRTIDLYTLGSINLDDIKKRIDEIDERIYQLKAEIDSANNDITPEAMQEFVSNFRKGVERYNAKEKRRAIELLDVYGTVTRTEDGFDLEVTAEIEGKIIAL